MTCSPHGFTLKREGASFRAKDDRYNIVIQGDMWFDNRAGNGGAGAIDLEMHLSGEDFRTTCRVLAEGFRPTVGSLAFPKSRGKPPRPPRRSFKELAAEYAVPCQMNWSIARDYLVEKRGINADLVDQFHDRGLIYANDHRPNPALVFLHRTKSGTIAGATLRDTRHDSSFRPTLGNKVSAWFAVGDLAKAETIVAVESPIDALSYHELFTGRNDRVAIASCAGSIVPEELLFQAYDRKQRFVVGFDNDSAGENGWQRAWNETTEWTGFQISSACPQRKDWNADLMATRPAGQNHHMALTCLKDSQTSSSVRSIARSPV